MDNHYKYQKGFTCDISMVISQRVYFCYNTPTFEVGEISEGRRCIDNFEKSKHNL